MRINSKIQNKKPEVPMAIARNVVKSFIWGSLIFATIASAQTSALASEKELRPFADKVMQRVGQSDFDGAFKLMQPYASVSEADFKGVVNKSQQEMASHFQQYGATVGYEFIQE